MRQTHLVNYGSHKRRRIARRLNALGFALRETRATKIYTQMQWSSERRLSQFTHRKHTQNEVSLIIFMLE